MARGERATSPLMVVPQHLLARHMRITCADDLREEDHADQALNMPRVPRDSGDQRLKKSHLTGEYPSGRLFEGVPFLPSSKPLTGRGKARRAQDGSICQSSCLA